MVCRGERSKVFDALYSRPSTVNEYANVCAQNSMGQKETRETTLGPLYVVLQVPVERRRLSASPPLRLDAHRLERMCACAPDCVRA